MTVSPTDALKGLAEENRAWVQRIWGTEGARSEVRRQFRAWGRGEGGVGGVASRLLSETLLQEVFNQRVWRLTAQLALPESESVKSWTRDSPSAYIHMVVSGSECSESEVAAIKKRTPQLFARPDSQEWVDTMVLPFRSAVTTQFAKSLVSHALASGEAEVKANPRVAASKALACAETAAAENHSISSQNAEFRHALSCAGRGTSSVDANAILSLVDTFEGGCLQVCSHGSEVPHPARLRTQLAAATQLLRHAGGFADDSHTAPPQGDAIPAAYLASHLLHAHAWLSDAPPDAGALQQDDATALEELCLRWVDDAHPGVSVGVHRLKAIASQGYVPAQVAYAARVAGHALQARQQSGGAWWRLLHPRPPAAGCSPEELQAEAWMREVLSREDPMRYPVAAYLLGVLAEADEARDVPCLPAPRKASHRHFRTFLEYVEEADQDGAPVPWAPFGTSCTALAYPFLPLSREEAVSSAKARVVEADRRAQPKPPSAFDRARSFFLRHMALVVTYTVLGLCIAVLLALNLLYVG